MLVEIDDKTTLSSQLYFNVFFLTCSKRSSHQIYPLASSISLLRTFVRFISNCTRMGDPSSINPSALTYSPADVSSDARDPPPLCSSSQPRLFSTSGEFGCRERARW